MTPADDVEHEQIPDEAWPGNIPPAAHEDYEPAKRKRWPIVVLGLLLLVGCVAAAPLLISSSWLNSEIRTWLRDHLETPADFQTLEVSWSEGVRLTGLEVFESRNSKTPMLYVREVEMDVSLLPLLGRRLAVKKLVLTDPVVRISQNADGSLNGDDVVKTGTVVKKRNGKDEEATVLPEIDVPVEVRNLTFVFVNKDKREVERRGIEFAGHLTTRDGPTTFRLRIPDGAGQLALDGEATLFDEIGTLLPKDAIEIRSKLRLEDLDAATNRDVLALFLGDSPVNGRLDGTADVTTRGGDIEGSLNLSLRGLAVGAAVGSRDPKAEDLHITTHFSMKSGRLELRDTLMRGEGLLAQASAKGALDALEGRATMQLDLERAAAALRTLGVSVPDGVRGRIDGELVLTPQPSGARGTLTVLGLRLPPAVEGGGDVIVDRADGGLEARISAERIDVTRLELRLPDGTLSSTGWVGLDGTLEMRTIASGDVGAIVTRARDLGLAPRDLALAGSLDANVVARRAADDPGIGLTIETLALRGDGVAIDVSGTIAPDGRLNVKATGDGALEKLLAAGGTTSAGGVSLATVRGAYSFAATVKGTPDAPEAALERLRIDGDLQVDAAGSLNARGDLDARMTIAGSIADAVRLLRGLGFVEGDVPLEGRIDARVIAGGTREFPTVPEASLKITGGPVALDVQGSLAADGTLSATASADVGVDALLRMAHAQGLIEHAAAPGGRLTARAVVGGSRDAPEVKSATATLTGPIQADVEGSLSASPRTLRGRAQFRGALQPLADLAAQLRGAPTQRIDGNLEGSLSVDGALDALQISLQRLAIRSAGLTATAQGKVHPDGTGDGTLEIAGPLEGLVDLVHAAGFVGHLGGTGVLDISVDARVSGRGDEQAAVGSLTASLRNLALLNADNPGGVFHEADLRVAVPAVRYEIAAARTSGPVQATITTSSGLRGVVQSAGPVSTDALAFDAGLTGPVQPLLDAVAFLTGGTSSPVAGNVDVALRVQGTPDVPSAVLRHLRFRSDTLTADAEGSAERIGTDGMIATGNATVRGAIAPLLTMLRSAGVAADLRVEGNLDATARLESFQAGVATTVIEATARDVTVLEPPVAGARFREPEIRVARTTVVVDTATAHVRPFLADIRMKGLETTSRVEVVRGTPAVVPTGTEPPPTPRIVTLDAGRFKLGAEFVRNHPELFPETTLESAEGTFAFRGDVSRGMEGAAGWAGSVDVTATGLVVPYVNVARATLKSVLAGGELRIDPLDAQVNGGTAQAKAVIGLVGEKPEHRAELRAQGIALQGDLAPALSRISPVLAVGESGRAGGTTGLVGTFTAKGLDVDTLKRSLHGSGTLSMSNVFAESGNWIGTVLDLVGAGGGRLDVTNADVPFEIKRGQVTTQEVGMTGGAMDLLLGGTVGLDGSLDYGFKVRPKKRGGTFDKYAKLLDPAGYLPLRLGGDIGNPDLKLPSVTDVIKGSLGGLLDGLKDGLKDKLDPKKTDAGTDKPKDPPADDEEEVDDGTDEDGKPRKKRRKRDRDR